MDLEEGEVALPIEGFPSYLITNRGRVWSTKRNKWLATRSNGKYYRQVNLGRRGTMYIHILVGRHFLPEYKEGLCVCHRNEELPYPDINFVENLWAGTHQQNMIDRDRKGRGNAGMKGRKMTLEHKRKISEAQKKVWTKRKKM